MEKASISWNHVDCKQLHRPRTLFFNAKSTLSSLCIFKEHSHRKILEKYLIFSSSLFFLSPFIELHGITVFWKYFLWKNDENWDMPINIELSSTSFIDLFSCHQFYWTAQHSKVLNIDFIKYQIVELWWHAELYNVNVNYGGKSTLYRTVIKAFAKALITNIWYAWNTI